MIDTSTSQSPVLQVAGLAKSFGGIQAVLDVSFSAREGQTTGLIGPNGAGKSTVLEVVSGFLKPDHGVIRFAGQEIQSWPAFRISRLGLMRTFQLSKEWPTLTVMENMLAAAVDAGRDKIWRALLTPGKLRTAELADRVKARELLASFGLFDLRDDPAGSLSGGQKRLLEFARVAIANPRMVLLDEPLAGVNPVMAERVLGSIRIFSERGIGVLLVEHNMAVIESLCSSVIVMAAGRKIAEGTMEQLRSNPEVTDAYLGKVVPDA
jgi:ABC-type branched-subunit amino acid transport system ATPase component